jgi:hypothetical protein
MAKRLDKAPESAVRDQQGSPLRAGLTLSRVWLVVAVGLPVATLLMLRLPTVDLAYLIRAGDVMLHTHHVLRVDPFTFTIPGQPWVNQQWGAEVVLAALYRLGGWPLLVLVRGIAGAGVFLLVYLACRARGASTKQAAWLTLGSAPVALGGLLVRPQMFGVVLFALTVWILHARKRRPRALYAIPAIVMVWANLHGSFFLGPLLVGLASLDDIRRKSPGARRLLVLAAVSAAAANIGPFGFSVWGYALDVSANRVITRVIVEWQAPSLRDALGVLFFASVALAAVILARSARRVPWTSLLTLGVFFLIGLFAVRGIFWWAIAAPPILVDALPRKTDPEYPPGDRFANRALVALVGILVVAFLPWWRLIGARPVESELLYRTPVGITNAVSRLVPPGARLFVDQPYGSWFELALPGDPVFVDSRIELFPTSVWSQYFDVTEGRSNWEEVLMKWGVDAVVANPSDQRHLIAFIGRSPKWQLVYSDRDGLVFVRAH